MKNILQKVFGTSNDRIVRSLQPVVEQINALEPEFEALSDAALKAKTEEYRQRVSDGESLDVLLPEAFATVREAAKRTLGQRHYDVQLMGGIVLHRGMISEMKTGEGKTLVSTLPVYLNALSGKGVHVVTVNDYLASRDSEWMGKIYDFLGLSVGCIVHGLNDAGRKEAYGADITYGTNNEYGFDYLRDNMKFRLDQMVQRPFNYAIVDEVDSILVDEARTPLIISGPVEDNTELYTIIDRYIPDLRTKHYEIDEKANSVTFSEEGTAYLEEQFLKNGLIKEGTTLYDIENISIVHHADQALRAHKMFEKDKDYIVKDNQVIIIDEFTGRMMEGRRYSDGLHQALEAKERVKIQNENQTLASITFQNYFRMYPKLAGMTGTAMTEADEFDDIYKLQVVEIPTHVPIARIDEDDDIYRTANEKYEAIIELIEECHKRKQPVLVGTASIERSEYLSSILKKKKVKHHVLNARYHEQEAYIIAQAGQPGAVTIATNMAGRGTDIQLGGNEEMLVDEQTRSIGDKKKRQAVMDRVSKQIAKDQEIVRKAGGLCVIGTERHESRRIDNQLRGRSGRQGDPGYSKFFLSAEDDLIRIFGADKKMDWVLGTMGEPGQPIAHPMITKMMEKAQMKVEGRNYEIRKSLLKFDDVMNDQRTVVYDQRKDIMQAEDADETILDMASDIVDDLVAAYIPARAYVEQWETETLTNELYRIFGEKIPVEDWAKEEGIAEDEIGERVYNAVEKIFDNKKKQYGEEIIKDISRQLLLWTLDELWKDHLLQLDHLRQGIGLRRYAQKDPLNEYKREAFEMFSVMLGSLRETAVNRVAHMEMGKDSDGGVAIFDRRIVEMHESRVDPAAQQQQERPQLQQTVITHVDPESRNPNDPSTWGKIARNEACPCGSGKKYKQCHGQLT